MPGVGVRQSGCCQKSGLTLDWPRTAGDPPTVRRPRLRVEETSPHRTHLHTDERKREDLSRATPSAYFERVITLVRVARVLVLLLLAFVAVSLVVGLGTSGTGAVEKVALLALIAGCVFLAAKVSTLATRAQARLQRH
jgi:hypothetical protein